MRGSLLLLIFVYLIFTVTAIAQTVNETASVVSIEGEKAVFRLTITAPERASVSADLELLDVDNVVIARTTRNALRLQRGEHVVQFSLPLGTLTETANDDLAWYRLRYKIGEASGIVSLSQLLRDLFELRITASGNVMSGTSYRTRVRAVNPFAELPAAGVNVETTIQLDLKGDDDEQLKLSAKAVTDADGFAVFDFPIPMDARLDGDGELIVTGKKAGLVRRAEEDLESSPEDIQIVSMTDKPIYQPGQALNLRGIMLRGSEARTVVGGTEVEFRIEDDDGTLLYREKVVSSAYGVASFTWRIPTNAKLGEYRIEIRDGEGDEIGTHRVKVSRYDLPNFAVQAKSSKPYYLPEDKEAEIDVRADYLFGKPVTKGKVRVVEENSREWNWKEQKYDISEGEVREGEIGVDGKFTARFDLTDTHNELNGNESDKYEDLKFAAYVTDLSTNRTEQRRFEIRVTRDPIHIYLIGQDNLGSSQIPMNGYVSTFYADGTPAACDIEISASVSGEEKFVAVGRTKTNSFGAGEILMQKPKAVASGRHLDFRLIARDSNGRRGSYDRGVYFRGSEHEIRATTDKTIYKPGETMNVRIESSVQTGTVFVDVVRGWSVIDSRFVTLTAGKADIKIPYREKFRGELKLSAFIEDPADEDETIRSISGVIFPSKQGINVDATFDKALYKPNEEATVRFGILDVVGKAVESALGVVVFDKAVEERARTDSDFGNGMFRNLGGFLGFGNSFGNVNVKDLNELDLTKPISNEMQLVAEIILQDQYYTPNIFRSKHYYDEAKSVFASAINKQMEPIAAGLKLAYEQQNLLHPTNDVGLKNILDNRGVDFASMRDPWGSEYIAEFSVDKARNIVTITTLGPDKLPGTRDDFTAYTTGFDYFTPMGRAIDTAINNYHATTGKVIRDERTLFAELGVRELIDRYGRPYKVVVDGDGRYLQLRIRSAGRDGNFEINDWGNDDFYVWTSRIDFFSSVEKRISAIQSALKRAPMSEAEFNATLKATGVDLSDYRDGNGNHVYVKVEQRSRFWDKVTVETVQNFTDKRRVERSRVTPVTQEVIQFTILGVGRDGKLGTYDDITLTQVVHVLSERSKDDPKTKAMAMKTVSYAAGAGMITGTVTDPNGAVVAGATVSVSNPLLNQARSTTSDDVGSYLFANLASGTYSVRVDSPGFKTTLVENVVVTERSTTTIDITIEPGAVSETVSVMSSSVDVMQTTNTTGSTITTMHMTQLPVQARSVLGLVALQPGVAKSGVNEDSTTDQQTSTPRLREYFPETLLWQPEIVTDASGRAQVKFRMADNITTWKMYTIASTKDGKVGFGEKEVTAFQSFFVDLDPPKFLTLGDEIFLPTQVRNYTEKKQNVKVTMAPADWFSFLDGETKQVAVGAGETENAVFGFKAITPAKEARQRVTAMAETDSDAIERPVTVRPDGREIVGTESRYFTGAERFDVNFPSNALPNTRSAELKIYPNLMAHVAESIEGLLRRPYGCGEQTISSTYPNLMILKFAGESDAKSRRISETVERKARKFLQSGYERLLGYQVADGGFSYWGGKDSADFALTAYALRFLADASRIITVDPEVVKRAEGWLIRQQRADGSWNKKYNWESVEDEKRAMSTTTYVARVLAKLKASGTGASADNGKGDSLTKALVYLKTRNATLDDPYSLSLLGLAAFDAGDEALARTVASKLTTLAKDEAGAAYWNLESNTAFNGWGSTGRIETTALATQLFLKLNSNSDLVGKAMVFLLKNKDRYGVWYSTQTTINVLDTFVASLATSDRAATQQVQVLINGQPVTTIEITPDKLDQIIVDLNGKLAADKNVVELRSSDRSPLMVQIVSNHYIDWKEADAAGRTVNQSRALTLDYTCDRSDGAIMQEVSCSVAAERVGYRGYGMLLAEIGTPPGADVSRESLQAAMDADWSISRYDILPDRIVLYMWSKAGGTKFNFKFRPRYGINAQTPASVVYDYYNPEAQATVAPLRFAVK